MHAGDYFTVSSPGPMVEAETVCGAPNVTGGNTKADVTVFKGLPILKNGVAHGGSGERSDGIEVPAHGKMIVPAAFPHTGLNGVGLPSGKKNGLAALGVVAIPFIWRRRGVRKCDSANVETGGAAGRKPDIGRIVTCDKECVIPGGGRCKGAAQAHTVVVAEVRAVVGSMAGDAGLIRAAFGDAIALKGLYGMTRGEVVPAFVGEAGLLGRRECGKCENSSERKEARVHGVRVGRLEKSVRDGRRFVGMAEAEYEAVDGGVSGLGAATGFSS